MAVDNPWWWVLTLAGAALVAVAVVLLVRGRGSARPNLEVDGDIPFYLDEDLVLDLYQFGGNALSREVETYFAENSQNALSAKAGPGQGNLGRTRERSTRMAYSENVRAINAASEVIKQLRDADLIIYADLRGNRVEPHDRHGESGTTKLSDSRMFVSVVGTFTKVESPDTFVRFRAPYGHDGQGHVRIKLNADWVRGQLPEGELRARCLGKIEEWNAEDRELKMWVMAIFR
ncbi:hypothetical protein EV193_101423 [Herbihabitans rhizosphaerae]|uniref:Uncharacterized protein n=1 Tax=Herbihabitans rhizosphaerae TaxID=1872711 RepID=A0A4Q7L5F7_9PSEU|nr:hypothetical protein [Herbihabitans rhizosphaerae]RZS44547.1 hypothetical protein EV193_101423 [Herbihabitans rhizosphaerae]